MRLSLSEKVVLVCGGRNYSNQTKVDEVLDDLTINVLVHGAATGADTLADNWAKKRKIDCFRFPAKWKENGMAAGPIRNQRMLDVAQPDLVVAFPGGNGTKNMIEKAKSEGIEVLEIK